MEKLKEYAGVIIAVMTVAASLSGLVLWAIQVQIVPEIRHLDGRIESVRMDVADRLGRMDNRMDARFNGITDRLDRMDKRIDARFDGITKRLDRIGKRMDARLTRAEGDIKTILLRLPRPGDTAEARVPTPEAH